MSIKRYASSSVVIFKSFINTFLRVVSVAVTISWKLESVESGMIIILILYVGATIVRRVSTHIKRMGYELTVARTNSS